MSFDNDLRDRNVTAVLGPTNTGKTHLAIERMLGHESGIIGLPLRLLAREVYDRIVAKVGAREVALITGEEKIKPERARYWVSTVEAMPSDLDVAFLAIDEVQLAGDPERGHVFTDRLLHARGSQETLLLGAQTVAGAIADLVPGANFISRPRLSQLSYAGQKKITRLPRRTALVAFSAHEVYAIGELMRRQRGGAAVVLGALSPRTRNAQVELYQSGDVDFLVATDAVGMGLNLDVDHVAFSAARKFDGERHRDLTPGELGQIAGRAGRHMNDGTFGVTGALEPFAPELVERLESHTFDRLKKLQWRNRKLEFSSLERLHDSLRELPDHPRLIRARGADDLLALEAVSRESEIKQMAGSKAAVAKLWDVCQVPDYRKISGQNHAELVATLYKHLMGPGGYLPEDWFKAQVAQCERTDGDIDTLSTRIAHIRTWTFVSNRADWLKDPAHWQGRTRQIEDKLSDAMHEQLTLRFVDKRTSALMKGMRDKDELFAEIAADGAVHVEKHYVGRLLGFCFTAEDQGAGIDGKAARNAAAQVLGPELAMRARRIAAAKSEAFKLTGQGRIVWRGEPLARIEAGEDPLKPTVSVLCDEHLSGPDKEKVQARLESWLAETIEEKLKPLAQIGNGEDISGLARGIAFRLKENFGCLRRGEVAGEIRSLDQPSRAQLRRYGVRFGAFNIYFPLLLKPAPAELLMVLWTLKHGAGHGIDLASAPQPPRAGLTSLPTDAALPPDYYRVNGFHLCGPRAVRVDILERLADLIRPLMSWRANAANPAPPPNGATGEGSFTAIPEMMSILGCSADELGEVLRSLGFRSERREVTGEPVAPDDAGNVALGAGDEAQPGQGPKAGPAAAAKSNEQAGGAEDAKTGQADAASAGPPGPAAKCEPAAKPDGGPDGEPKGEPLAEAEKRQPRDSEPQDRDPQYIEIWRPAPRRRSDRHAAQSRSRRKAEAPNAGHGNATRGNATRGDAGEAGGGDKRRKKAGAGGPGGAHADRGGKPGRQNRRAKPGAGHDRRDGSAPPRRHGAPSGKSRAADPDSPFAALGSLKKKLEKRSEDPSAEQSSDQSTS